MRQRFPMGQRPGSPTAALELKTPNVDRTGPLPLRCETALDRVSSPPYWQMTPPTRLCRDAAGSLRSAKKMSPPMNTPTLGIDMAKLTFVAALWFDRQRFLKAQFDNSPSGFRKLHTWCQTHGAGGALRVAVESTSTYAEALLEWLYTRSYTVFLLNPEQVAHYARACGQRNKTDPADAVTIAAFIAAHEATPWQPPPPQQKDLRTLTRARAQARATVKALGVQLQTSAGPARPHLQALLDAARRTLRAIERDIAAHLRKHPRLGAQVRRLMTLKGVGLVTAAIAIAELPPITAQTDP